MTTLVDGHWLAVRDGDLRARALFTRHYSATLKRSQPLRPIGNAARFTGPGEHMVLLSASLQALFVWRAERFRLDQQTGIVCSIFRNESPVLSSDLIREAVTLAWQRWPGQRLFTYVADAKIRSTNPGCCFIKAGFRRCGRNADGRLTILERLPDPVVSGPRVLAPITGAAKRLNIGNTSAATSGQRDDVIRFQGASAPAGEAPVSVSSEQQLPLRVREGSLR